MLTEFPYFEIISCWRLFLRKLEDALILQYVLSSLNCKKENLFCNLFCVFALSLMRKCVLGMYYSIGAQRVQRVCIAFRNFGEEHNIEGWVTSIFHHYNFVKLFLYTQNSNPLLNFLFRCLKTLQLVKHECAIVQNKLESLFKVTINKKLFHHWQALASILALSSWS